MVSDLQRKELEDWSQGRLGKKSMGGPLRTDSGCDDCLVRVCTNSSPKEEEGEKHVLWVSISLVAWPPQCLLAQQAHVQGQAAGMEAVMCSVPSRLSKADR